MTANCKGNTNKQPAILLRPRRYWSLPKQTQLSHALNRPFKERERKAKKEIDSVGHTRKKSMIRAPDAKLRFE